MPFITSNSIQFCIGTVSRQTLLEHYSVDFLRIITIKKLSLRSPHTSRKRIKDDRIDDGETR